MLKRKHSKRKQFRMAKNLLSSEIFITWTVTREIKKQVVVVVSLESAVQVSDGVSHKRSDILDLLLLINHHKSMNEYMRFLFPIDQIYKSHDPIDLHFVENTERKANGG